MPERLSDEARQYIVRNRRNGIPASRIAGDLGVSDRTYVGYGKGAKRPAARA